MGEGQHLARSVLSASAAPRRDRAEAAGEGGECGDGLLAESAVKLRAARGRKADGRFCGQDVCQSPRGAAPLRRPPLRDLSRGNACRLRAQSGSRGPANAGAGRGVSSDENGGLFRAPGRIFEAPLALVVHHEFDAAARLSRHSSRVLPWPLASGTSGQKAMNHDRVSVKSKFLSVYSLKSIW